MLARRTLEIVALKTTGYTRGDLLIFAAVVGLGALGVLLALLCAGVVRLPRIS